jgi:hypothetical protein
MITIQLRDNLINVAVLGEFTLADFKEFEQTVRYGIKFQGRVNLLVDLRDMTGFTLDVAWEDLKFTREHQYDFWKIAVVTDSQWIAWSAWLSSAFVDAGLQVFTDYDEAVRWVTAD